MESTKQQECGDVSRESNVSAVSEHAKTKATAELPGIAAATRSSGCSTAPHSLSPRVALGLPAAELLPFRPELLVTGTRRSFPSDMAVTHALVSGLRPDSVPESLDSGLNQPGAGLSSVYAAGPRVPRSATNEPAATQLTATIVAAVDYIFCEAALIPVSRLELPAYPDLRAIAGRRDRGGLGGLPVPECGFGSDHFCLAADLTRTEGH